VPAFAAQFSAFGAIASDIRAAAEHDISPSALLDVVDVVNSTLERITAGVLAELAFGGLSAAPGLQIDRTVGLRFYRQVHRLDIAMPDGPLTADGVEPLLKEFRRRYEQVVGPGSANADTPVEVVAVSASATLAMGLPQRPVLAGEPIQAHRYREAWFNGAAVRCPVIAWERLALDQRVVGPALIESDSTTLVVHPGQVAVAEAAGHLRLLMEVTP
jgi:N-methylhydantoinase A